MDARKTRYAEADLADLFSDASTVIAAKGKKVLRFDMKKDAPEAADLAKAVLGPSGNLRAPTLRMGKTFVIGFNPEVYEELVG